MSEMCEMAPADGVREGHCVAVRNGMIIYAGPIEDCDADRCVRQGTIFYFSAADFEVIRARHREAKKWSN